MKHYLLPDNSIRAFEADGSQDHLITAEMQPITYEEVLERTQLPLEVRERREFKAQRGEAVNNIKVTTASGNTFDGDETSQNRMARAVLRMSDTDTIKWVLADNTEIQATKAELAEALDLAGQEQAAVWTQETS